MSIIILGSPHAIGKYFCAGPQECKNREAECQMGYIIGSRYIEYILCAARDETFRLSAMAVPPPLSTPDYTPGTDGLSVPSVSYVVSP